MKKNLLADLFLTFAKIGLFTFGGGYAMISMIENDCVENRKWISHDEMMDIAVIAESTPGPIAINCATYIGYKQKGLIGAIITTLGIVIPSFLVVFCIALFLDNFLEIKIVENAFRGIRIAVGILIIDAALKMIRKMKKTTLSVSIVSVCAVLMFLIDLFALNFSSISLMLMAGAISLALSVVKEKGKESDQR